LECVPLPHDGRWALTFLRRFCAINRGDVRYLKAVAVGLGTGILAAVLWIVLTVILPVEIQMAQHAKGYGGVGAVTFNSIVPEAVFLLGFVLGCTGSLRRSRR